MRILALLLLLSCASWAPTREAGIRRIEAAQLRNCVTGRCRWTRECIHESIERCRAQGLEATCGSDELFTDTPIRCHP